MSLTLLDLYNTAATQEWSMYDNDATNTTEFESSLVLALNKAISEIYSSYNFPFRQKTHIILTRPDKNEYDIFQGLIIKDSNGKYLVKCNSELLEYLENTTSIEIKKGLPQYFYIKGDKIVFYPTPAEKSIITIDYMTLAVGETSNGTDIFELSNATDILNVPEYLEQLMKNAVITRTMLNSIASESDENYSAYKKQADKALRLLIKYSKGVERTKMITF